MASKGSSFANFVRFRQQTYACTQQSLPNKKTLVTCVENIEL